MLYDTANGVYMNNDIGINELIDRQITDEIIDCVMGPNCNKIYFVEIDQYKNIVQKYFENIPYKILINQYKPIEYVLLNKNIYELIKRILNKKNNINSYDDTLNSFNIQFKSYYRRYETIMKKMFVDYNKCNYDKNITINDELIKKTIKSRINSFINKKNMFYILIKKLQLYGISSTLYDLLNNITLINDKYKKLNEMYLKKFLCFFGQMLTDYDFLKYKEKIQLTYWIKKYEDLLKSYEHFKTPSSKTKKSKSSKTLRPSKHVKFKVDDDLPKSIMKKSNNPTSKDSLVKKQVGFIIPNSNDSSEDLSLWDDTQQQQQTQTQQPQKTQITSAINQYILTNDDLDHRDFKIYEKYYETSDYKIMRVFKTDEIKSSKFYMLLSKENTEKIDEYLEKIKYEKYILIEKDAYLQIMLNDTCLYDEEFNPHTYKCVKKCNYDRVRTYKNFNCISKSDYKTRKQREYKINKSRKQREKEKEKERQKNKTKKCSDGYERNPFTKNCVKKCSKGYMRNLKFDCIHQKNIL